MEKTTRILVLSLLFFTAGLVQAQSVPRAEVEVLIQSYELELREWRAVVQAQNNILEAKQAEIDALKAANDKWQQAAGTKTSLLGKVWWGVRNVGPLVLGTVTAIRVGD